MALHQHIQKVLLLGARLDTPPAPPVPAAPPRLQPLVAALAPAHAEFDAVAIRFGHRYRSGFWAIYLLSAMAVLCAMMPLALGWDDITNFMHPYGAAWVIAEVLVIASVAAIYRRGHRHDWQGQWLRARTIAELTSWLPLIAPLERFPPTSSDASWYGRALGSGAHTVAPDEVLALCRTHEESTRSALVGAWDDPSFVGPYVDWAAGTLQEQEAYHLRIARRYHVLQHRIHRVTAALFVLTAVGALAHLVIHSRWISLITTVFPALGAALHGALAQSEAYRLESASARVARELRKSVDQLRKLMDTAPTAERTGAIQTEVRWAIALILQEHQDWTMLVRPHHLPLG